MDLFPSAAPPMRKSAWISECGLYRYTLTRHWDEYLAALPVCMLNPSTADAEIDDPTVKALIHFARLWGYGGIHIVNLYALRTSSPTVMMANADRIGPENIWAIQDAVNMARLSTSKSMLTAWGNDGDFEGRGRELAMVAAGHGIKLICLGVTNSGAPMHPMARGKHRIPRDRMPMEWKA